MADHDIRRLTANEAEALDEAARLREHLDRCNTERQRLQADLADCAHRWEAAERALDQARDAARTGDRVALWDALDIPPSERPTAAHVPLDTAPGFNAGEPLTEQEIRSWALDAASRIGAGIDAPTVRDLEQTIIGTAERYADWIATGSTEAWDWRPEKSRGGPTTPEAGDAEARGYARAVAVLRDDNRYRNWWTADGGWQHEPTGRYWSPAARGHLADYVEAVEKPLPSPEASDA